jgi:hypothetical protein
MLIYFNKVLLLNLKRMQDVVILFLILINRPNVERECGPKIMSESPGCVAVPSIFSKSVELVLDIPPFDLV